ncbi:MAG: hypothetical protein HYV63_28055 [Candidatus Schekmanbacteria bacterium]|nr:hypothetical protein [Candidatus Schekmanbacteria bacterium]
MFWDSSAFLPLVLKEPFSAALCELEGVRIVWWGTRIECLSAIHRTVRESKLSQPAAVRAIEVLERLLSLAAEVQPIELVRERGERVLRLHPLRAADAFQLAAALVLCEDRPRGVGSYAWIGGFAKRRSSKVFRSIRRFLVAEHAYDPEMDAWADEGAPVRGLPYGSTHWRPELASTIDGYEVLRELGRGATCVVYLVRDDGGNPFALKRRQRRCWRSRSCRNGR